MSRVIDRCFGLRPLRLRLWLRKLHGMLDTWHRRARDRRRLAEMDPRALRDIGIHPGDVDSEIRKPFWKP